MSHNTPSRRLGCVSAGTQASSKSLLEISYPLSMNRDTESYPTPGRNLAATFPRRLALFATADTRERDQCSTECRNPSNDHRHPQLGSRCAGPGRCGLAAPAQVWLKEPA